MKLTVYHSLAHIPSIETKWEALHGKFYHQNYFYSLAFIQSWYNSYPEEEPLIIVIEDPSGDTILIAPLVSCADGWVRIAGHKRGDYNAILFDTSRPEAFTYLLRWIIRQNKKTEFTNQHQLNLTHTLFHSPFRSYEHKWLRYQFKKHLSTHGFSVLKSLPNCPYISNNDKAAVTEKITESKTHVQRLKVLSKKGAVTYRCIYDLEEIRGLLPALFNMHIAEWKHRGQHSLFENKQHTDFYLNLLANAEKKSIRLDVLYADTDIAAMHFGFEDDLQVYYYKPCYHTDYQKLSAGSVLLNYIILDTLNRNKSFDFLKGAESYKHYYTNEMRSIGTIRFQRSSLLRIIPSLYA